MTEGKHLQVVVVDEDEESVQCKETDGTTNAVRRCQEVRKEERVRHPWHHFLVQIHQYPLVQTG